MEQTNALLKKQLRLYRFIALLLVLVVLSTVNWNGLSKDIGDMATQAQESLATASKAVDELDIETLNKAIRERQTVVEPLAKLVGRFG